MEITSFDDLREQVKKDMTLDDCDLDSESARTPKLYMKYLNLYYTIAEKFESLKYKEAVLVKDKTLYYMGKAPAAVYQKAPFNLTVTKTDLPLYLNSDAELNTVRTALKTASLMMEYLEQVNKQVRDRGFQIKNIIDWRRFTNGSI